MRYWDRWDELLEEGRRYGGLGGWISLLRCNGLVQEGSPLRVGMQAREWRRWVGQVEEVGGPGGGGGWAGWRRWGYCDGVIYGLPTDIFGGRGMSGCLGFINAVCSNLSCFRNAGSGSDAASLMTRSWASA